MPPWLSVVYGDRHQIAKQSKPTGGSSSLFVCPVVSSVIMTNPFRANACSRADAGSRQNTNYSSCAPPTDDSTTAAFARADRKGRKKRTMTSRTGSRATLTLLSVLHVLHECSPGAAGRDFTRESQLFEKEVRVAELRKQPRCPLPHVHGGSRHCVLTAKRATPSIASEFEVLYAGFPSDVIVTVLTSFTARAGIGDSLLSWWCSSICRRVSLSRIASAAGKSQLRLTKKRDRGGADAAQADHPAPRPAPVGVGASGGESVASGESREERAVSFFSSYACLQAPLTNVISDETLYQLAAQAGVRLDESSMAALRDIGDDFVESVSVFAAEISKHARSDAITAKDVQLHLEQNWGLSLPLSSKKAKTDGGATSDEERAGPASTSGVVASVATPVAPVLTPAAPGVGNAGSSFPVPPTVSMSGSTPLSAVQEGMARVPAHAQRLALKQRLLSAPATVQPK